ncbi:unnamed protein product [Macrosiphum euphorbiae]|nr:unnamed protein product [Macrosiphum euphorbiae]
MNAMTTALLLAAACSLLIDVPAASGYRAVRTSGPLPVTVHVRAGGVVAGGPVANRTSGVVFPASVASSPTTTTTTTTTSTSTGAIASAANAAAAAAAGFTSFSTSSSASNHTGARNQTRSERLRAR